MKHVYLAGLASLLFACGPAVDETTSNPRDASSTELTIQGRPAPSPLRCTPALLKVLPHYCDVFFRGLNATTACIKGTCVMTGCIEDYTHCGDSCVDISTDMDNCGECGKACSVPYHGTGTATCTNGVCGGWTCADIYQKCGDACLYFDSDRLNCGSCGNICPDPNLPNVIPACEYSACGSACTPGWADCDGDTTNGCETDIWHDVNTCGGCAACPGIPHGTPVCATGRCFASTCDSGFHLNERRDGCVADCTISGCPADQWCDLGFGCRPND